MMTISGAGLELIKVSEGFRATVYKDVVGFGTIGYGHKLPPGETFPDGVTEAHAASFLLKDVRGAEEAVTRLVKVTLTQGQYDSLVDFVFNLGEDRLASSTLLKDLNAGKYAEATSHPH